MAQDIQSAQTDDPVIHQSEAVRLFTAILNNFSGIFRCQSGKIQSVRFNLVNLGADPSPAEVGDLAVVGGKLKICVTAGTSPVWVTVGTQT